MDTVQDDVKHPFSVECRIPDCSSIVSPLQKFHVCDEHLIAIWRYVDSYESASKTDVIQLAKRHRSRELAKQNGSLYVLDTGHENAVKIGWTSRHISERIAEYPPTFKLIVATSGTKADERDIHRSLSEFRIEGKSGRREWYHAQGEVVRQINSLIAQANMVTSQQHSDAVAKPCNASLASTSPQLIPRFESLDLWRAA